MKENQILFKKILVKIQKILKEIDSLEKCNKIIEIHILNATQKDTHTFNNIKIRNKKKIQQKKQQLEQLVQQLSLLTPLVSIDIKKDTFILQKAMNYQNVQSGIETISLYGTLSFNCLFEAPNYLVTKGHMSLEEYEQYHKEKILKK